MSYEDHETDEEWLENGMSEWEEDSEEWNPTHYNAHKELSEEIDEGDVEANRILNNLIDLTGVEETLSTYGYKRRFDVSEYWEDIRYPLKKKDRKRLLTLVHLLIENIYDFLWNVLRITPDKYPHYFVPKRYRPRKYRMKLPYRKYWKTYISPYSTPLTKLFPPFLTQVELSEEENEDVKFLARNLIHLCEIETFKTERMVEDGKLSEQEIINIIRKDMTKRGVKDKELQDQLLRDELTRPTSNKKLIDFSFAVHKKILEDRKKEEEQRRLKIVKQRKRLEALKKKKKFYELSKKEVGKESAKEIIEKLHSKKRRGK